VKFHDAYNIEKLGTSHNTPDQSDFSIESTAAFILIKDVLIMYCKLVSFTFYPTFTVKLLLLNGSNRYVATASGHAGATKESNSKWLPPLYSA